MKNNLLKTAAACLLIFASLMSLAACTAKPAEPTDETPAQTQTPNTTSRPSDPVETQTPEADPQPEEQPDDTETPEEQPAQQVSVQELLRLAEQQDPEFPATRRIWSSVPMMRTETSALRSPSAPSPAGWSMPRRNMMRASMMTAAI